MRTFMQSQSTESNNGHSGLNMRAKRRLNEIETYRRLQSVARSLMHPRSTSAPAASIYHNCEPCITWLG